MWFRLSEILHSNCSASRMMRECRSWVSHASVNTPLVPIKWNRCSDTWRTRTPVYSSSSWSCQEKHQSMVRHIYYIKSSQPRWLSGLKRSRVHSLWLLVDHCVLRNWDRILVRAVKGLISRLAWSRYVRYCDKETLNSNKQNYIKSISQYNYCNKYHVLLE